MTHWSNGVLLKDMPMAFHILAGAQKTPILLHVDQKTVASYGYGKLRFFKLFIFIYLFLCYTFFWCKNDFIDNLDLQIGLKTRLKKYIWQVKNLKQKIWILFVFKFILNLMVFLLNLSLIHIWRCRRSTLCRSRWSPYH